MACERGVISGSVVLLVTFRTETYRSVAHFLFLSLQSISCDICINCRKLHNIRLAYKSNSPKNHVYRKRKYGVRNVQTLLWYSKPASSNYKSKVLPLKQCCSVMKWVKWREMKWNEVRWSEVRWSEVKCGEVRWSEMRWGEVRWSDVRWVGVTWAEAKCRGMDRKLE